MLRLCRFVSSRKFSGLPKVRVDGESHILREAYPKLAKIAIVISGGIVITSLKLSELYDTDFQNDPAVNLFQV